jgi:hypothetical protein
MTKNAIRRSGVGVSWLRRLGETTKKPGRWAAPSAIVLAFTSLVCGLVGCGRVDRVPSNSDVNGAWDVTAGKGPDVETTTDLRRDGVNDNGLQSRFDSSSGDSNGDQDSAWLDAETACFPCCEGLECGTDGCGGSCGQCPCATCHWGESECLDGFCVPSIDPPEGPCLGYCHWLVKCYTIETDCMPGHVFCEDLMPQQCVPLSPNLTDCMLAQGVLECSELYPSAFGLAHECILSALERCVSEVFCPLQYAPVGGTCSQLRVCLMDCSSDGTGGRCYAGCYANFGSPAVELWLSYAACLQAEEYFSCPEGESGCSASAEAACAGLSEACDSHELTCVDVIQCAMPCTLDDDACAEACAAGAPAEDTTVFESLCVCMQASCIKSSFQECLALDEEEQSCGEHVNECVSMSRDTR